MASALKQLISQYSIYHTIYIDIAVAIITFFMVVIIGKLVIKFITKLLEISNFDYHFKEITGIETLLAENIEAFGKAILYLAAAAYGLNQLSVTPQTYLLIFLAIIVVVLLSAALRVKDFIPNFYYGFKLRPKRFVKVGDKVRMKNVVGKIKKMKLNGMILELRNKDQMFIPNLSLTSEELRKSKL